MTHDEPHRLHRSGWLRASLLGAMDGVVSISSLIVGVAAAESDQQGITIAATAGLIAGAMSMAAGEYVSVKSQQDTEHADLSLERASLRDYYELETEELAQIYRDRGLTPELAQEVANQLMAHDALGSHARDEIGITDELSARPLAAAMTSAATFSLSGGIPLVVSLLVTPSAMLWVVPATTIVTLALLGGFAGRLGGASPLRGAMRVCVWGSMAMAITALVGYLFGVNI